MHTETLQTALRVWTGPTRDHLSASDPARRAPWVIACWEAPDGQITATVLEAATDELHGRLDAAAFDPAEHAIPTGWLESATGFDHRMRDLASGEPTYLAGIGLLTREPSPTQQGAMCAYIATGADGAFVSELHDGGAEASVRLEAVGPMWWDLEHLLIPLERYRALVSGDWPRLPAYAACEAAAVTAPSTDRWTSPC